MRPVDIVLAMMVAILWGVNFVAIKIGVMHIPPIFLMAVRFCLVAILLAPWLRYVTRQQILPLLAITLTMSVGYFTLLFVGMHTVPAGETTILVQSQVPLAAMMAMIFFRERLSGRKVVGIIIGLIGVVVTVGLPQRSGELLGVIFVLVAAFLWALSSNQIRALGKIHPLTLNGFTSLCAFPILWVISLKAEPGAWQVLPHISWMVIGALFFMVVISTIICYSLWFALLSRNPVSYIIPFIMLEPPAGLLTAHFVLDEPIYWHTVIGGVLCLLGLAFVTVQKRVP